MKKDREWFAALEKKYKRLISEFVNDLKVIECHRVFGEDETLLDIILDKLKKWEEKLI